MIKLNAAGQQLVEEFLNTHVLASAWDTPRLQSIVAKARAGSNFCIVLYARFTVTGSTEVYRIPPEGFDLYLPWREFNVFANNAQWTSVNHTSWGVSMEEGNGDPEGADARPTNGFNQVSRETSALHPSGKRITVVYDFENIYRDSGLNDQNPATMCAGTWSIDGLTLIGPTEAPIPYTAMHTLFEGCEGRFGHRNGHYATDMKTYDTKSLMPNDDLSTAADTDEKDVMVDSSGTHYGWRSKTLAKASSEDDGLMRWQEWILKIATDGTYVCLKNLRSMDHEDHEQHMGGLFRTKTAVISFFGQGPLAKRIYRQAGIAG